MKFIKQKDDRSFFKEIFKNCVKKCCSKRNLVAHRCLECQTIKSFVEVKLLLIRRDMKTL